MDRSFVYYYYDISTKSSKVVDTEDYFNVLLARSPTKEEKRLRALRVRIEELEEAKALQDALEEYPLG